MGGYVNFLEYIQRLERLEEMPGRKSGGLDRSAPELLADRQRYYADGHQ